MAMMVSFFSVSYTRRSMRTAAYRTATDLVLEADRMFLENPHLRPYFFENVACAETDDGWHKVSAAAEFHLDVLECIWDHRSEFQQRDVEAWREWIHDLMETSPAMRDLYTSEAEWYPTLSDVLNWEPCVHPDKHEWASSHPGPQGTGVHLVSSVGNKAAIGFRLRRAIRRRPGLVKLWTLLLRR